MMDFAALARVAAFAFPVVIAVAIGLFVRRRRSAAAAIADRRMLGRLSDANLLNVPVARVVVVLLASLAISAALIHGNRISDAAVPEVPTEIVLLLDASGSMLVEDAGADAGNQTRLEAERSAARKIVSSVGGTALGLVVFAGDAFILSPQTYDYSALHLYLDALHPSVVTQTGSSLASAIRQGTALIASSEDSSGGALVLISDGDALEPRDSVLQAARLAGDLGIRIHTVGVGNAAGAAVPDLDLQTGEQVGFKREPDGSVAISALDEALLREISGASGGEYFRGDQRDAIDGLLGQLVTSGPGETEGEGEGLWLVQWLLLAAVVLLALEALSPLRAPRSAGLVLITAILVGSCDREDPVRAAEAAFRAGEFSTAAIEYARAAADDPSPLDLRYNLGTALLAAGNFEEARPHLEQAALTDSAAIAWRAHYNSGNSDLVPAFRGDAEAGEREKLARAAAAYRNSLRINPEDLDAKWNYELAMRLLDEEESAADPQEPEESGDGGGGGGGGGTGGADLPRPASPSDPQPRLSPSEAARILDSAQERELAVQQEALDKPPPPTPPIRGW